MSKQAPSAHTTGAVGSCPTLIKISRTPQTLEVYPAPSHHPTIHGSSKTIKNFVVALIFFNLGFTALSNIFHLYRDEH